MINYYRLDKKSFNDVYGGKAQIAYEICKKEKGIVTCGSRDSVQVLTFAQMCDKINIPCYIHIPKGKQTETIEKLEKTNANIIYEKVGYNNVLNSHAKLNAENLNYKFIPLGMIGCEEAKKIIMNNTKQLLIDFPETKRIVTVIGSGTTMIGICEYLNYIKSDIPVLGILVGIDSTKNIAKNTTYKYYNIIKSEYKYQDKIKHEFLNSTYEAKCVEYLEEGDTLYVVAK